MKILAFDQATNRTGWCLINDNQMYYGVIDLHTEKNAAERIDLMRTMIASKIKNNHPDIVVIEDVLMQRNARTLKELAQLQGVIIGVCRSLDIPFMILYPSEWRKILNFKQGSKVMRAELKQQAIDYVRDNYNITTSDDEADAICIACAYIISTSVNTGG